MNGRNNAAGGMLLTIIWLVTAAAALILTVVYIDRLQKLYAKADQEIAVRAEEAAAAKDNAYNAPAFDLEAGVPDNTGTTAADAASTGDTLLQIAEGTTVDDADGTESNADAADSQDGSQDPADSAQDNSTENDTDTGTGTGSDNDDSDPDAQDTDEAEDKKKNYDYSLGLDPEKPIIALSFDDGPSQYTERIIAALEENGAEATFFMVGYNVQNYKDTVRAVYDAGLEIANHTTDHKNLTELDRDEIWSEVFDNEDLINSVVPAGRLLVRPPYGSHNSTVRAVVARPMINWSVDSLDWKTRNADSIVAQIKQDAKDGYVVLMHDLYETTAEAAERIIPWLIDNGYQVTCISKMFKARGEKLEDGEVYRYVSPAQK